MRGRETYLVRGDVAGVGCGGRKTASVAVGNDDQIIRSSILLSLYIYIIYIYVSYTPYKHTHIDTPVTRQSIPKSRFKKSLGL